MNFIVIFLIISGVFLITQKTLPSFSKALKIKKFFYSTLCVGLFFVCLQFLYHHEVSSFWKYVTITSLIFYVPFALYMRQQFWSTK